MTFKAYEISAPLALCGFTYGDLKYGDLLPCEGRRASTLQFLFEFYKRAENMGSYVLCHVRTNVRLFCANRTVAVANCVSPCKTKPYLQRAFPLRSTVPCEFKTKDNRNRS